MTLLSLATLRALKAETDLSISRHPELIAFLANAELFSLPTIKDWMNGGSPFLVTDLRSKHGLFVAIETSIDFGLHPGSILTVVMNLQPQINLVIDAIKIGGSTEQKTAIDQIMGYRIAKLPENAKAKTVLATSSETIMKPSGIRRKGKRRIDLTITGDK